MDADGNYGYKKVGADTVIPFRSAIYIKKIETTRSMTYRATANCTLDVTSYKKLTIGSTTTNGGAYAGWSHATGTYDISALTTLTIGCSVREGGGNNIWAAINDILIE